MDVHKEVQEFFLGIRSPRQLASTLIILIPKVANPSTFADFCPICLTNFIAKVITRLIAMRLSVLLPKLISQEQVSFMKGRDITEQILLAQEMVHVLDRPVHGGHVLIKLDMAKVFDRVFWSYLQQLLHKMGFHPRLVRILMNNLASSCCSILINGKPTGCFLVSRGVKQDNPLSPLIFILASKGFLRGLNSLLSSGYLIGFQAGRVTQVSHLGFADDLVVFLNGSVRNLQRFRLFLESYQQASGQLVNLHKSQVVMGAGVSPCRTS